MTERSGRGDLDTAGAARAWPEMGPRGEGWAALQLVLMAAIAAIAQPTMAMGHHCAMVWLDATTPAASRMPQTPRASSTVAIHTVLGFILGLPSDVRWLSLL